MYAKPQRETHGNIRVLRSHRMRLRLDTAASRRRVIGVSEERRAHLGVRLVNRVHNRVSASQSFCRMALGASERRGCALRENWLVAGSLPAGWWAHTSTRACRVKGKRASGAPRDPGCAPTAPASTPAAPKRASRATSVAVPNIVFNLSLLMKMTSPPAAALVYGSINRHFSSKQN